jgi:hypothetical protein
MFDSITGIDRSVATDLHRKYIVSTCARFATISVE